MYSQEEEEEEEQGGIMAGGIRIRWRSAGGWCLWSRSGRMPTCQKRRKCMKRDLEKRGIVRRRRKEEEQWKRAGGWRPGCTSGECDYVKRDVYTCKETRKRNVFSACACQHVKRDVYLRNMSKETCIYETRPAKEIPTCKRDGFSASHPTAAVRALERRAWAGKGGGGAGASP